MATLQPLNINANVGVSSTKSGARTSEFWFFILAWVVSFCVGRGWIPAGEEERAREIAANVAELANMAMFVLPMVYGGIRAWMKSSENKVAAAVVNATSTTPRQVVLNLPTGPVIAVFDPATNTVTRVEAPAAPATPTTPAA